MENEKKNTRAVRKTNLTPMIRYQSFSMPIIVLSETETETCEKEDEKINVEGDDEKIIEEKLIVKTTNEKELAPNSKETLQIKTNGSYERTFITFENEQLFNEAFKKTPAPRPTLKSLCAITR